MTWDYCSFTGYWSDGVLKFGIIALLLLLLLRLLRNESESPFLRRSSDVNLPW